MDHNQATKFIQCNTDKSKHSFQDFITHFITSTHSVALVSEPYIGAGDEVKSIRGLDIFQFPNKGKVKACIITKPNICCIGLSQYSSPNLCVVRIRTGHKHTHIASAYIEPETDTHNTLELIDTFLHHTTSTHCILGGDFNGWHPLWGSARTNQRGGSVVDMAHAGDLFVCNTGSTPTFEKVMHGRQCSSIIDLTFASAPIHHLITDWKVNLTICPSSQHNAIEFTYTHTHTHFHEQANTVNNTSTFLYKNNKAHWTLFKSSLLTQFTNNNILDIDIHTLDSPLLEDLISNITAVIHNACRESMPVRVPGIKTAPLWWADSLQSLKNSVILTHHQLHSAKRRGEPTYTLASELNTLKTKYAEELKKTSTSAFKEFCQLQTKENVWSLTNRLLKNTTPRRPPATLKVGGVFTTNTKDTAEALLDHFYPDDSPDSEPRHNDLRAHSSDIPETANDPSFTWEEVLEIIKCMNPKRAPGLDNLTSDICLQFALSYPELITNILNQCLALHYFPKQWKRAYVKIIPKANKVDCTELTSYRPIGLLPVFGKLLEKLFIKRVTYAADKAGKLNDRQYGFRQQTNTTAAISAAIGAIRLAKTDKLLTVAISLDIKAAFDNAWWPALFHRLRLIDCPKNIYRLIQHYTHDRTVTLDYADSRVSKGMTKGCIQGSTCGPILWNVILDELLETELPHGCHLQAFADDVLLIVSRATIPTLQSAANQALQAIVNWGQGVKLSFSPTKTQAIAFSKKAKTAHITMDTHTLQFQSDIKILGVILDEKFTFNKHAQHIISKATHIFNQLTLYCRPTWGAHPENIRTIYLHVIEPIVTYAAGVWGQAAQKKSIQKRLLSMQRGFAIRAIKSFRTVSTSAALALAQFTPVDLKVREVHLIESTRLTHVTEFLPEDVTLETPTPPRLLLHPAIRLTVSPPLLENQREVDKYHMSLPPHTHYIFTDGSKQDDDSVGAAFVCYCRRQVTGSGRFKLHNCCSVFQAELFAVLQACKWASLHKCTHTVIHSDSRSAIQAIQERSSTNPLVSEIHSTVHACSGDIQFAWVRSHAGIEGNEAADVAAKKAASLHMTPAYHKFPISYIKNRIRQDNYTTWENRYTSEAQGQHTKRLLPTLSDIRELWKHTNITFTLTQTLTGHSYTKHYLHRFKITEDDTCPCDDTTIQTLDHLFKDCPRFGRPRFDHELLCESLGVPPFNIKSLMKKAAALESFVRLSDSILSNLKEFNDT